MRSLLFGATIVLIAAAQPAILGAGEAEDKATANRIAQYLKAGSGLHGYEIGVMCREGTAWLKGTVASSEQADMALEVARQTEGVDYVVDLLTIEQQQPARQQHQTAPARQEAIQASIVKQPAPQRRPLTSTAQAPYASSRLERRAASSRSQSAQLASSETASLDMVEQAAPSPARPQTPRPYARTASAEMAGGGGYGQPVPAHVPGTGGARPVRYDSPNLPGYAWPSYASHPNYGALTYPKQYSPTAWPYIGPFYPYPQVPLGWRKVTLEWDDGWWMLDFKD